MVKTDRNNCVRNEKRAREREKWKPWILRVKWVWMSRCGFFFGKLQKIRDSAQNMPEGENLVKIRFFYVFFFVVVFFLQCRSDCGAFILHCHAIKYEFQKCFLFCFVLFSPDALHIRWPDDSTPQSFCAHPQFPSDSGQSASAASDRDAVGRSLGDRLNLQPLPPHVKSASSLRGENKRLFYPSIRAKEIIWFPFITRQHVVL